MFFVFFICNVVYIKHFVMYNNGSWGKIESHPDMADYFKELPFITSALQQPEIKRLKSFYEGLNVIKTNDAFRGYAMSYKVKLVEKKIQLNS